MLPPREGVESSETFDTDVTCECISKLLCVVIPSSTFEIHTFSSLMGIISIHTLVDAIAAAFNIDRASLLFFEVFLETDLN